MPVFFTVQEITCEKLTPGGGNDEIFLTWKSKDEVPSMPPVNEHSKFWPVNKEYESFSTNGETKTPNEKIQFPVDRELEVMLWEADEKLGETIGNPDDKIGNYILFPEQNITKNMIFEGGGGQYQVKGIVTYG